MKKFSRCMAGLALVMVGGVALAACGGQPAYISAAPKATLGEGASAVEFVNASDFMVTKTGEHTFKAEGGVSTMDEKQATAYWDATHTGDNYVVLRVELNEGDVFRFGFVTDATTDLGPTNYPTVKEKTAETDGEEFILGVKKDSSKKYWKLAVTGKGAEEATVYTVDMTGLKFTENE